MNSGPKLRSLFQKNSIRMSNQPLFQLRKEVSTHSSAGDTNTTQSFVEELQSGGDSTVFQSRDQFTNEVVLTENEKYSVKRLAPSLSFLPLGDELDGLVDTYSGNALVNDKDNLYIWKYNSSQRQTAFARIPLHDEYISLSNTPKIVFTWPAANDDDGASKPSGVCIVNKKSGLVQFYEDINTINNLSSLLSKSKVHELNLKLKDKEMVIDVVNSEPSGILVSTNFGRLLLITIHDSMGKPCLQLKQQLIKSQVGFFHSVKPEKEIVSLRPGPILGKGERLLSLVTGGGDFQIWNLSAAAHSFKRISVNLHDQIVESLQDLYPFAHRSLHILSSHPLPQEPAAHVILSSINNSQETYYILSTVKFEERTNSFTIFSTYRLNTYTANAKEKPQLFIPSVFQENVEIQPVVTSVYVLFNDAVVLTQVSSKLDHTYPLRRKWEDIISFRADVHLIGCGYDSESIYLINREIGVIKIATTAVNQHFDLPEARFIKSHINQAIYFSGESSNPIEFNLPSELELERVEIESDLLASSEDILLSKSEYIPPKLSSLEQHLNLRVELYKNLLSFTKKNFIHRISPQLKLNLIENFEILNCALSFCSFIGKSDALKALWEKVLTSIKIAEEDLFLHQVNKFPKIFSQFLQELTETIYPSSDLKFKGFCADLVITCIYKACLEEGENHYRYSEFEMDVSEVSSTIPWFTRYEYPEYINLLFFDLRYTGDDPIALSEFSDKLLALVKILYYQCKQASMWFNNTDTSPETDEYERIRNLYENNNLQWNQVLCQVNRQQDSLQITEFYEDLEALVETLDTFDKEEFRDLYNHYFEKFGYKFSARLFSYYISKNKLKNLFFDFPEQHDYLVQFFEENPQFGNVAWIGKLLDEDYQGTCKILSKISNTGDDSGQSIDTLQLHLSVAKLCALVDQNDVDMDDLTSIQVNLDVIDGQRDLYDKLKDGARMNSRFKATELEKIFEKLTECIKSRKSLSLPEIIEYYTMLSGQNNFYCALKLLSLNTGLDFEVRRFLVSTIWRRCILSDDWQKTEDDTQTTLFYTLTKFFDEELFLSGCALPEWNILLDKSILTQEYFSAAYGKFCDNIEGLEGAFFKDLKSLESLGNSFSTRLKALIGSANERSGKRCVINYEKNTVELM